ncbi:MAG: phosphoribosylanthranilate isomerase [Oscillospiraceae bacterium]|nr:phosphoribosylanthranilate isomerase [Oscillospiraceae bacterium]
MSRTRIKLCGLSRPCDIETANRLQPDFIGFVFAPKSRRYVAPEQAAALKAMLAPSIQAVGVFVREEPEHIAALLRQGVIDIAQLHGGESEDYVARLRALTDRPIIKAFRIEGPKDIQAAQASGADYVLLDNGAGGTGTVFDWGLVKTIDRPYFLAGGLDGKNVRSAVETLRPYAVDVSSGIETEGRKDTAKMERFVAQVRAADREETTQ